MNIRTRHLVFTLVVSLGLIATSVASDETQKSIEPPADNSLLVAEPTPETPQYYLHVACLNCQKGNDRIAAAHIRDSVKLMRRELRHATASGKLALERSIRELEAIADSLDQGAISSLEEIRAAFARSQHALAYHYQQRAAEWQLRRNFKEMGRDLQAAADNVAYGLNWVGEGVQVKSRDVIVATRDLGGSLIRGAKTDAQQINEQANALGQEIKRFGLQVVRPVHR